MDLAQCIISFLCLVFVASLVITSFYNITRGTYDKQADGTIKKNGMILKAWYFFWMEHTVKEDSEERIYKYPEWLRSPIVGCISCLPTVYGNLIFWVLVSTLQSNAIYNAFLYPFANDTVGLVVIWLAYWLSCSYVCTLMWSFISPKKDSK